MMRTLIAIAALVATVSASARETPTQFMERYVGYFNAEDLEQYQATFEFPAVRFTGGVLEILSDPAVPMANFENIKKTDGSPPESTLLVSYQSPQRPLWWSFVLQSTPQRLFNSTGHYGLVNTDDGQQTHMFFEPDYGGMTDEATGTPNSFLVSGRAPPANE